MRFRIPQLLKLLFTQSLVWGKNRFPLHIFQLWDPYSELANRTPLAVTSGNLTFTYVVAVGIIPLRL
jgi:hypothetical protein